MAHKFGLIPANGFNRVSGDSRFTVCGVLNIARQACNLQDRVDAPSIHPTRQRASAGSIRRCCTSQTVSNLI